MWAGTGLRGLLAGERVKGPLPSPYLAKARVQGRGELMWVWWAPYQCRSWSCSRPGSPAEEHFGLGAGLSGEAAPTSQVLGAGV